MLCINSDKNIKQYYNRFPVSPARQTRQESPEKQASREIVLPEGLRQDPLFGTAVAAKALNITPVHLRRLVKAGKIPPPLKIGFRKLAWRLSVIEKLISDRQADAQGDFLGVDAIYKNMPTPSATRYRRALKKGRARR